MPQSLAVLDRLLQLRGEVGTQLASQLLLVRRDAIIEELDEALWSVDMTRALSLPRFGGRGFTPISGLSFSAKSGLSRLSLRASATEYGTAGSAVLPASCASVYD